MFRVLTFLLLISLLDFGTLSAQGGYHFGTKGGLTLANQNWNGGERRPLIAYHANLFIESRDPEGKGSLFAQVGYHQRGSSIGLTNLRSNDLGFKFNNLSLLAGAKRDVNSDVISFGIPYYFLGIRGEYTVSHNLLEMRTFYENLINNQPVGGQPISTNFLVEPAFVNRWMYGISIGGGFEFEGSEFFNAAIEFTFSQDISNQYNQLPNSINDSARQIKNQSFEISLVLRFLREVIYED